MFRFANAACLFSSSNAFFAVTLSGAALGAGGIAAADGAAINDTVVSVNGQGPLVITYNGPMSSAFWSWTSAVANDASAGGTLRTYPQGGPQVTETFTGGKVTQSAGPAARPGATPGEQGGFRGDGHRCFRHAVHGAGTRAPGPFPDVEPAPLPARPRRRRPPPATSLAPTWDASTVQVSIPGVPQTSQITRVDNAFAPVHGNTTWLSFTVPASIKSAIDNWQLCLATSGVGAYGNCPAAMRNWITITVSSSDGHKLTMTATGIGWGNYQWATIPGTTSQLKMNILFGGMSFTQQ